MAMKPSVWTAYYHDLPFEECIALLKKAGFNHSELSTTYTTRFVEAGPAEKVGKEFAAFLADQDFSVPQGHLNFKKGLCTEDAVESLKKELAFYQVAGIKNAVLHFNGGNDLEPQQAYEKRLESVGKLQEFLKGTDVFLCLENLGSVPATHTVERLNGIIDALGGENLGICLDVGHLHLVNGRKEAQQTQEEFILGAGSRLRAMHVTNNNGLNDVHQMPFSARYGVDWVEVVRALKKIGYEGLFNLEILGEIVAPLPIRWMKLEFIKKMTDYMLSDEFIN